MTEKPLVWIGTTLGDVRSFPAEARRKAGRQLLRVQRGLMPHDWKAMPSVGRGAYELRVKTTTEHRIMYVARHPEAVYVLHAFEKRSRKTRKNDIALARKRLTRLTQSRLRNGARQKGDNQ